MGKFETYTNTSEHDLSQWFYGHGDVEIGAGETKVMPCEVADAFNSMAQAKLLVVAVEVKQEERAEIIKELELRGVEFSRNTPTKSLKAMLEKAE